MKLLHTAITVRDLDSSISFYTDQLGLKLIRRREIPENNAETAFLSCADCSHGIELTYWRDKENYIEGDQLDHFGFEVDDIESQLRRMKKAGVEVAKDIFTLQGSSTRMAFVRDPNGIWIELIEKS